MSFFTFILCLFTNADKDSVPIFKYLSTQDTILLFSSDFEDRTVHEMNTVYYLSDDAIKRLNNAKDKKGSLYYYLESDKLWVYVQQVDYYSEYIPFGFHVITSNKTFLIGNEYIDLGHRIPPVMLNSKKRIKQRYKRMLNRPYSDAQFVKILHSSRKGS